MKKILLIILLLVVAFLTGWYNYNNLETKTMNEEARAGVNGSFIALTDGVTHYEIAGPDTAEAIVLVHGYSVPLYIWDGTYDTLVKAGYRVLRYDTYGRGYSDRPDVDYNEELYDRQLLELTDKLKLKTPFHLAGLSFGGPVTAYFSAHHPEKVKDNIFVDPATHVFAKPSVPYSFVSYVYTVSRLPTMAQGQSSDFYHPENFPGWAEKYEPQMKYKGFKHALLSTVYHYQSNTMNQFSKIKELNKPVLLIWGKQDTTTPFAQSEELVSVLKPTFLPVEDAGHLPHLEKPALVNGAILTFLKH